MIDLTNHTKGETQCANDDADAKVVELDRYLRLAADFENYKKRVTRERDREASSQKIALVSDLLPIVDNLERALAANANAHLRDGVKMVLDLFMTVLNRHGFEPREDLGAPFDGRFHDAIAVGHNPKFPPMAVIEVWQRGWMRGEALFRPAKVLVNDSTPAAAA
ncbi:MAG TPA: nucleotide exchange factor GrpE [Verrucomicrobiae bacterium]|nr:nucleotide exchange factor GrpE [Verrucomicrobiae bacterium]